VEPRNGECCFWELKDIGVLGSSAEELCLITSSYLALVLGISSQTLCASIQRTCVWVSRLLVRGTVVTGLPP
jgi:hypothetical protein